MPTRHERERESEARDRARRQRNILIGVAAAAGAVVLVALVASRSGMFNPPTPTQAAQPSSLVTCAEVRTFPSQGSEHIQPDQQHPPYNSNPPTSGWHWDAEQTPAIHTTPQVQEQLVHNLEHGHIVIQYKDLSSTEVKRLADLVNGDPRHMLLAPYPGLPADVKVALTAWTHLQTCSGVDENAIRAFIRAYRDKGPEFIP